MAANGWLRLELRYLAALERVAATGSFSEAADELGYTQSAVSQQIAALERLVGQPLIGRRDGRRPVGLTPAGSLLLEHAQAILARTKIARAHLDAFALGKAGTLRVGTYQSVGIRVLPRLAARLAETHPDLRLEIREAGFDLDLVDLVGAGELDVTFCVLPLPGGPYVTERLFDDPFVLLASADSELRGRPVPLERLGSLPLIGYQGCRITQRVESFLHGLGIDLHHVAYAGDNQIIQALVAERRAAALVTRLSIDHDDERTVALALADWVPPRQVGLAWHRDQEDAEPIRVFVEAARFAAREWRVPVVSAD
jgi:DNA-binding transcriptional LysR family regulator